MWPFKGSDPAGEGLASITQLGSTANQNAFTDWRRDFGVSDTDWAKYSAMDKDSFLRDYSDMEGAYLDPTKGSTSDSWYGDMTGSEIVGAGLGLGQLGLGLASYLENSKTADKQRALLDQQLASNTQEMAHRTAARNALNKAFSA